MSDLQSDGNVPSQPQLDQQNQKVKVFEFQNGRIMYCNVEQTLLNNQSGNHLAVHNYLCYQEQDKLIKITEILLQDKILRIKDELKIITEVNQGERWQKRRLGAFGRRNNYSDPSKNEKSDTKNLIKNIINLFANWLRLKSTETTEIANRKLKKIVKKKKYYNKMLIQELCKDKDICECFIEFSETDSETAIDNSRIKDKQCHYKAIKNYTKLFEESKVKLERSTEKSTTN